MESERKKVLVAMSGGVDSSVAALLLKNEGYDVSGAFMKNWADPQWPCPWQEDRQDALRVCLKLGIPFQTFDFTKEYKEKVVDYMTREYAAGRTPNPDVVCNREIKFGLFFAKAMELGFDYIATGHYARKSAKSESSTNKRINQNPFVYSQPIRYSLIRARDLNKDQSYFLWTLKSHQLEKTLFPIGEIESKAKVREIAREYGLPVAEKKDSQGICFMGPVDVAEFIKPHVRSVAGDIITTAGPGLPGQDRASQKIGTHQGLDFFTIGQRKGIGVGGTGPYYVAQKNYETNTLVVAPPSDQTALESNSLVAADINLINPGIMRLLERSRDTVGELAGESREELEGSTEGSIRIKAAIRYRQDPVPATLSRLNLDKWKVEFENPVRAITPGQSVVFYHDEELIGGGVIDSVTG